MHPLLPETSLAQLTKSGSMTLWTIPSTDIVTWCGNSHPTRDRPCGPAGPIRSSVRSTEAESVRWWGEAWEEDTQGAEWAVIILGSSQSSAFFRFLFSLFSRSAFQKPLYLNRASLHMKDFWKPPVGRSLNSPGSRSSVGTFQDQPQCGLRRNSCFAVSGFPWDSCISCGHNQIIRIPGVLREPCLSTQRPPTEMEAFTHFWAKVFSTSPLRTLFTFSPMPTVSPAEEWWITLGCIPK